MLSASLIQVSDVSQCSDLASSQTLLDLFDNDSVLSKRTLIAELSYQKQVSTFANL